MRAQRAGRAVVIAGTAVGLALVAPAGGASASGAPTLPSKAPYADRAAVGSIGLCNRAGRQVTSGSVDAKPFAWRAVSTQSARAPYDDAWRTATLYAYQPRRGLTAAEWSGTALTASSRYSNPAHPMSAATTADMSLEQFLAIFKPQWNGFLQLRIYLGTKDAEAYTAQYPVLDIQVTGKRWRAVGGGPVNCRAGTAESLETIVHGVGTTTTPTPRSTSTPSGQGTAPRSSSKGHRS
jgi:hypothetical protein